MSGGRMNAGASSAAGLLAHSVEDVRWLHIDIARLLVDVLERFDRPLINEPQGEEPWMPSCDRC